MNVRVRDRTICPAPHAPRSCLDLGERQDGLERLGWKLGAAIQPTSLAAHAWAEVHDVAEHVRRLGHDVDLGQELLLALLVHLDCP
eukprot:2450552-Pyramimonas_sp.AAC.1